MFTITKHQDKIGDATSKAHAERFESLMKESYRACYSVAYRFTGNVADAEDLLQEAYIRAYRFFHRYDSSLPFQSWLYRIISNAHVDLIRRKGKLKVTSVNAGFEAGAEMEFEDQVERADQKILNREFSTIMQAALNEMNPEFRAAVVLADIEGYSYEEVAEIMETSVGTVRSRIHRGRLQLRNFISTNAPKTYARLNHEG